MDKCISETVVRVERKIFLIGRYENPRGEYLRVTETGDHRRTNTILIPLSGVADVMGAFDTMLQAGHEDDQKLSTAIAPRPHAKSTRRSLKTK